MILKSYKSIETIDIDMKHFMLVTFHLLGVDVIVIFFSNVENVSFYNKINRVWNITYPIKILINSKCHK